MKKPMWGSNTHEAVQLGHGGLVSRVTDVPHLDASLATGVDVPRGVANGYGAHHISVAEGVDLARVARDAGADERVRGEGHRLHLSVGAHVKGVGSGRRKRRKC